MSDIRNRPVPTSDGSYTFRSHRFAENYHSVHGALTESFHVFVRAGLKAHARFVQGQSLRILEMGWGTGLNAWLTAREIRQTDIRVEYTAVELFPLTGEEAAAFAEKLPTDRDLMRELHRAEWGSMVWIRPEFGLHKIRGDFRQMHWPDGYFDVIYYDAFSPGTQPELWTRDLFVRIYEAARPDAIWVSYVARGQVRRDLQAAGWQTERLPGPPGKREMLRARK